MKQPPLSVFALIDWHNCIRHISPRFGDNPERKLPDAILALQQAIARALARIDSTSAHRVTLRLYHGWHRHREPTPDRRIFEKFAIDPTFARRFQRISFCRGFDFGNELTCDTIRNPLYATYQGTGQETGQKMVDTAIACDLLHLLRYGGANIAIIVSDDDDLLPALFTAEAWRLRAYLIRSAARGLEHVTASGCSDLVVTWEDIHAAAC
jgi:hypothetical protein